LRAELQRKVPNLRLVAEVEMAARDACGEDGTPCRSQPVNHGGIVLESRGQHGLDRADGGKVHRSQEDYRSWTCTSCGEGMFAEERAPVNSPRLLALIVFHKSWNVFKSNLQVDGRDSPRINEDHGLDWFSNGLELRGHLERERPAHAVSTE
jgi:hypothetical protein